MKKIAFAGLAVLVAAAASCIIPIYLDEGSRFDRSKPAFSRTVAFAPGGTLRIDNAFGNIILIGWDREEAEILAEVKRQNLKPYFGIEWERTADSEPALHAEAVAFLEKTAQQLAGS